MIWSICLVVDLDLGPAPWRASECNRLLSEPTPSVVVTCQSNENPVRQLGLLFLPSPLGRQRVVAGGNQGCSRVWVEVPGMD